jgi:hypothetical protein
LVKANQIYEIKNKQEGGCSDEDAEQESQAADSAQGPAVFLRQKLHG